MINRRFYGMASELSHFLFMNYAVGLAIMAFKASQERYLPFGGISIHLKDFNALESNIYNKRDIPLSVHPFQYIIIINQQKTLMVSISGHSDLAHTFPLVNYSMAHTMGMILNVR